MTAADARAAAARIVGRVDREGAFSNVVSRIETKGMNPSDAGVARALAYDALRNLTQIDAEVAHVSNRPLDRIDRSLLDLLRVGVAELGRSDRPDALTVDAVVRAAKRSNPSHAAFANAVLRKVARSAPRLHPVIPAWLVSEMSATFDEGEIEALWQASLESPELGIRGSGAPGGFREVPGISGAWLGSGPIPEGFEIQDPASVAVGLAVAAQPGELILDMSAAPGGKTGQLVETGARVIAADSHRRRTRQAAKRVPGASWIIADGRTPPFEPATFDAVLLDAPCTGLGTLRRRPEIILRTGPEDVVNLATVARQLLASAIELVRPGGRVVYSVCTVTPSETVDVVAAYPARPPDLALPGRALGNGWLLAPHLGPTDGMFIAVLDR
jgi:16S rRNA (cytosine967-C5)-methyltransferase